MIEIPINKIKESIFEMIDKASNGEEVVVTKDKNPLVRIISYKQKQKKTAKFGSGKDKVLYVSDDFDATPEEFNDYLK